MFKMTLSQINVLAHLYGAQDAFLIDMAQTTMKIQVIGLEPLSIDVIDGLGLFQV